MTSHDFDYDYFVIGAGSGGVRSARIAAGHGAKVAIAEGRHFGGTCVNVGCVPKKLFTYASDYGPAFEDAKGYGWTAQKPSFDWKTLIENKNKEIARLNGIYKNMLQNAGVTVFEGMARFKDAHTILINDKEVTADKILIATGGKPRHPNYEGHEYAIVSDDAFYLDKLPSHIVIEGGGYIGVEFAHIFHGLGVKTTIIHRGDAILRGFDDDLRHFLQEELEKQGINVILKANITKITQNNAQYTAFLDNNSVIECDLVMSAIGRIPHTEDLDLNAAAIDRKGNGSIRVNEDYQTSQPHIYAIGDVTDTLNLTPVALAEGHVLADRLFNQQSDRSVSYKNIPTAIFSHPPVATVGLTEAEARKQHGEVDIYKSSFKPMRHTLSGRDERTLIKLIVDQKTDKVLGAHMCGHDAAEIMQGIGIALVAGATKADFDRTIGIHPTSAEEFVTMRTVFTD